MKFEIDFGGDAHAASSALKEFTDLLLEMQAGGEEVVIQLKATSKRTSLQNKALHQGFKHAEQACSEHGISKAVLFSEISKSVDFPADQRDIKEVARALAEVMYGKRSTTAVPSDKCGKFWDVLRDAFLQRLGVDIGEFPSLEQQRINSMMED